MGSYQWLSMPFEKKNPEDKMMAFNTTLKPEAYQRLKTESKKTFRPMSVILSQLILENIDPDPMWKVNLFGIFKDRN